MIADIKPNNKLSPGITKLFLIRRKFNISLVFKFQFYFKVPQSIRLNLTHYFIVKIPNKRQFQ